jgi:hypothetical protein
VAVVAEPAFSKLNTSFVQWQALFVHVSPAAQPQSRQQSEAVSGVHVLFVHVESEPQPQS